MSTSRVPSPSDDSGEALYHPSVPSAPWLGDNQFNWTTDAQGNIVYAGGLAPVAYEATNWRGGLPAGGWAMAATTLARALSRLGTPPGSSLASELRQDAALLPQGVGSC